MRIARLDCRWRVLGFGHVVHDCLEELALMQWERMVVARLMLMRGMDAGEVTERLGFTHANSFRTAFRQFHGMAPQRFMETRFETPGIDA
jgi:AraC-like DNA-binding protein